LEKTASFATQASAAAQEDRVFFTLKRPNAHFKFVLARHDHPIILERGQEFLGTGPYMLGPRPTPECFRLLRNPYYYKSFSGPSEIECRVYPLDAKASRHKLMEAVNNGQVDFTEDLLREQISSVQRMRRFVDLGFCTAILYFNTQRKLFAEAAVRMAWPRPLIARPWLPSPIPILWHLLPTAYCHHRWGAMPTVSGTICAGRVSCLPLPTSVSIRLLFALRRAGASSPSAQSLCDCRIACPSAQPAWLPH